MATWNVQGIGTKKQQVFQEIHKMNIDLCVLTETKKKGRGNEVTGDYIHFYTGVNKSERAKRGVSMAIHKKWKKNIKSWEEINDRIILIELNLRGNNVVVVGVYAPTEDADAQIKDDFYLSLTKVLSDINPSKETFILGDLNGRTGRQRNSKIVGNFGEDVLNDNGERIIDMCESYSLRIMNGFFPHKRIHQYTWCQPTRNLSSIIDYVIQKQNSTIKTTDVRVYRGAECGSDHFLLKATLEIKYRKQQHIDKHENLQNTNKAIKYNLDSLKQNSVSFLYKTRLANKLQRVRRNNVEELYADIKECIHEAANEALGQSAVNVRGNPEWWTKEIEDMIKIKKCIYHKWLTTMDREDRKLYSRINRDVKKEVTRLKNDLWERKCEYIGRQMGGTKVSEAWKTIKNIRNDENKQANLALISTEEWAKYYEILLTEQRQEFKWNKQEQMIDNEIGAEVRCINMEEFDKTLCEMKNGKSAGPGDIPIELVKHGPKVLWEELLYLMNMILVRGQDVPQEWNIGILTSIHKKGNKKVCSNYRGISVTSSIGRLYGRLLKKRIEEDLTETEEQSGFRAGRSCVDNIFTLTQLVEKRVSRNLSTHLIFIDLEKAYDSIPLSKLFDVLKNSSLNKAYVRSIYNLYKEPVCVVRNGKDISRQIGINKGLKQGCCLSPTLFKIYLQEALKEWCRKCSRMGIEVSRGYLYNLLFADDQVIIANDKDDAAYMFRKLVQEYRKWGLNINLKKTEYISIGEDPEDIQTEEGTVTSNTEFKYLGSYFTQDGRCDRDIRHRTAQGKAVVQRLNSLLWSSRINMKVKLMMYNSIVEPITTYASECWTLTKAQKKKLEVVEMDFLRRACRISKLDHIRNDAIRQRTNREATITDKIEEKQLIWYGHIKRMDDSRWPKRLYEYYPPNRRKRGRPRLTWRQGIQQAMEERRLQDDDWQNRDSWRLRCRMRRQP